MKFGFYQVNKTVYTHIGLNACGILRVFESMA